jgi:hypothetical protein
MFDCLMQLLWPWLLLAIHQQVAAEMVA